MADVKHELIGQIERLKVVSLFETFTLIALVFIAVPAKHMFGKPELVSLMGPVHGIAFLSFVWLTLQTGVSASWPAKDIVRSIVLACIPFGGFFNVRMLRAKQAGLAQS